MAQIPQPLGYTHFYCTFILPLYFDEDLDSYLKLLKIQHKVNELVNNNNQIIEWLNELDAWLQTMLKQYAQEILNQFLENGDLTIDAIYHADTETLSFVFGKKGV